MSLKCQLCGKELHHDRKICQTCEDTAINGHVSHSVGDVKKWRCDNFLELKSLPFGCNLDLGLNIGPKMIYCPECGEEYSYGRMISHTCEENSITFGKIFELDPQSHKWNCDTEMGCMELSESTTVATLPGEIPSSENLETDYYKWNDLKSNIQVDLKKSPLIYE